MLFFIVTAALAGILSVESTQITDCSQPPTFPYAKLETTSTTHGSYAFYSFQEPYKLIGRPRLQCLNGEWINMPICNNTDCAEPPTIPYADLEKTSTTHGSYAFYSFNDRYKLMGHQRVQCLNGEWINKPICNDSDGNTLPQHKNTQTVGTLDRDCTDLLRRGHRRSGVYTIYPRLTLFTRMSLEVYCDMETDRGGWTVIQRRGDFQNPVDYFYKDWKSYKEGFGDLEKEFWLGNDNIFALTNQGIYSARFDLVDAEGNTRYAHYDVFRIDDEDSKYTLHISNYSGDAGDSMKFSNDHQFSTRDQDNDKTKEICAQKYKGAWWFVDCFHAHLNGENIKGRGRNERGKIWMDWKGWTESLAVTEIKIRPKNLEV